MYFKKIFIATILHYILDVNQRVSLALVQKDQALFPVIYLTRLDGILWSADDIVFDSKYIYKYIYIKKGDDAYQLHLQIPLYHTNDHFIRAIEIERRENSKLIIKFLSIERI